MIEKIYVYSKEQKILKKYAFLPPLTETNLLTNNCAMNLSIEKLTSCAKQVASVEH